MSIIKRGLPSTGDHTGWRVAKQHFTSARQLGEAMSELGLEDAAEYLKNGDTRHLDQVRNLLGKLTREVESRQLQWRRALVGSRVDVPAMLSGDPRSMWHRPRVATDNAPVMIVSNLLPSGGTTDDDQIRRGAAIVALIARLRERRPVRLRIYADIGDRQSMIGSVVSCELDCSALDTSRLMALLASPEVTRKGMYRLTNAIIGNHHCGGWLRGHFPTHNQGYAPWGSGTNYYRQVGSYNESLVRQDVNVPANMTAIVIPALGYQDQIIKDNVAWINAQLDYTLGVVK